VTSRLRTGKWLTFFTVYLIRQVLLSNIRRPVTGFMADFVKLNKVHIFSEICAESCLEHGHEDLEDGDDVLCPHLFSHLLQNKLFSVSNVKH
jgi:hypothetical protein